jgi:hypothetical protein
MCIMGRLKQGKQPGVLGGMGEGWGVKAEEDNSKLEPSDKKTKKKANCESYIKPYEATQQSEPQ